ncbi:hypothetical protein QBC34DRAFT_398323 [Podospora aff. communis PSN243]|uniref:Secreted protein n=1 Tax=Podospora aff. communis PSN243 TaxID=3040156 RepID=A0AAV9GY41_9PEZI|nr:hypothetical protein QBC34DRAFT_398323 [Podospora aff. communis PSN243]
MVDPRMPAALCLLLSFPCFLSASKFARACRLQLFQGVASVDSEARLTKHSCRSVERHGSVKSQIIVELLQSRWRWFAETSHRILV